MIFATTLGHEQQHEQCCFTDASNKMASSIVLPLSAVLVLGLWLEAIIKCIDNMKALITQAMQLANAHSQINQNHAINV